MVPPGPEASKRLRAPSKNVALVILTAPPSQKIVRPRLYIIDGVI